MKQLLFSTLLALLTALPLSGRAQLLVGDVPLASIDAEYLTLTVVRLNLSNEIFFSVEYGQNCLNRVIGLQTREFLNACTGLKYANGEFVRAFHYTVALTLLRREGWELEEVLPGLVTADQVPEYEAQFILVKEGD